MEPEIWKITAKGEREFNGGKGDWLQAAQTAQACPSFMPDDEDEWAADEQVSCYNCAYRRWTVTTFVCCRP